MALNKSISTPFIIKLAMTLLTLIAIGFISVLGKKILSPLFYSFLFAFLLLPLSGTLERKFKLPRSVSSSLSVILLITFISIILFIVGSEITSLTQDWPLFKAQFSTDFQNLQQWISTKFHINMAKQMAYVNSETAKIISSSPSFIGETVLSLSSILFFLVFVMIDTFFLLFYRRLIINFLVAVFKEENSDTVYDIVQQVQFIIRKYILGLLLEMGIVATVCCLAFSIIGIKYPILLGLIVGLFNIIPYIGIFTSLLFSTIITIGTGAITAKIILVIGSIVAMHLIDSNVLLPLIVGSKVKINAFITLMGVVIGEMIWGISGMFLSIPVIAICKVIFDRIESLKPWGMLLGEEKDENTNGQSSPMKTDEPSLEKTMTSESETIK